MLAAELSAADVKISLPVVPAFELPAMPPGRRSVKELRVRGRPLIGSEVVVEGYITWIYDCARHRLARHESHAIRSRVRLFHLVIARAVW